MLRTEKQAAERWCPMVRIARREEFYPDGNGPEGAGPAVVAGCNTDALGGTRVPASCRCIGSECMMWRWGEAEPPPKAADTRRGYCGLAGKLGTLI